MKPIDYEPILSEIVAEVRVMPDDGDVASYIPELGKADPNKLGVHLETVDNQAFGCGDSQEKFSIQSISKVLSLTLALEAVGEDLWRRVGVEPSGNPFNSLVQLEYERGIPRNPLINAGAIVVCDALVSCLHDPKGEFLEFVRRLAGSSTIDYDPKVSESEMRTGYRNRALACLMKDFGNIHNDIDHVLDVYCCLCSIDMTCQELAQACLFLASGGVNPRDGATIVSARRAKRINAVMQMCGFYDEAGEFAFRTGLPGKSGVGGGIVAILPGQFSIAVWSPPLNKKGNSYKGMKVLEALTTRIESSIF